MYLPIMTHLRFKAVAFFLLALTVPLSSAASQPAGIVDFNFDPTVDFGKYRTYSWVPRPVPEGLDKADYEKVRASIDRVLAARGYRKAEAGDFAVAFSAVPYQRTEYSGSYRGGWASSASLSIDIYDTATRRPIWSGIGKKDLSAGLSDSQLDGVVDLVLNRFPPSHGCSHHPANEFVEECPQ
jgi:hypothetical protein